MRRYVWAIILFSLLLVGCTEKKTKYVVYDAEWDGAPIIVKEDEDVVNEITNVNKVNKLIKHLEKASWQENVAVDIRPPDYSFVWNGFDHYVWVNEAMNRVELSIVGKSNYGNLSAGASESVLEILLDH